MSLHHAASDQPFRPPRRAIFGVAGGRGRVGPGSPFLRAQRPRVAILDVDALANLAEVRQLTQQ